MKALLALIIGIGSIPCGAQTTVSGVGMNSPNYSTFQRSVEGLNGQGLSETPTMRAWKLKQAEALRAEAIAFLKQDNGELTKAHATYLKRKRCEILGLDDRRTGSLAPLRRCGT